MTSGTSKHPHGRAEWSALPYLPVSNLSGKDLIYRSFCPKDRFLEVPEDCAAACNTNRAFVGSLEPLRHTNFNIAIATPYQGEEYSPWSSWLQRRDCREFFAQLASFQAQGHPGSSCRNVTSRHILTSTGDFRWIQEPPYHSSSSTRNNRLALRP